MRNAFSFVFRFNKIIKFNNLWKVVVVVCHWEMIINVAKRRGKMFQEVEKPITIFKASKIDVLSIYGVFDVFLELHSKFFLFKWAFFCCCLNGEICILLSVDATIRLFIDHFEVLARFVSYLLSLNKIDYRPLFALKSVISPKAFWPKWRIRGAITRIR